MLCGCFEEIKIKLHFRNVPHCASFPKQRSQAFAEKALKHQARPSGLKVPSRGLPVTVIRRPILLASDSHACRKQGESERGLGGGVGDANKVSRGENTFTWENRGAHYSNSYLLPDQSIYQISLWCNTLPEAPLAET